MRRTHFDGAGGWIGRLSAGTVLVIGALIALAATASAQTPGDNSDSNSGTSENSGSGSGDGGSGDGGGDGDGGSGDGDGNGGSGDGDGDGGSGDGDGNGDGGSGDGDGDGDGDGNGGSGDGDAGAGGSVDPEEARIAACASRYGGYQAGWAEQTCRYPNLVWTRTIDCAVNRVYSERATGPTRNDQGTIWTQIERVVDYACTWDWRWYVIGGGPPPIPESEMIKPHEAETRVEPTRYRLTYWESGGWTLPISQEVVRPSQSANPGSGSDSSPTSGDGGSGSGDGGSGSGDGDGGSGSG